MSADLDYRVDRIVKKYDMKEMEALKLIQRRDSQRAAYYNYYTNKKWSDISSYDLSINVADLGIEGAVDLILKFIELKEANK
jgi:cytidylate kinase